MNSLCADETKNFYFKKLLSFQIINFFIRWQCNQSIWIICWFLFLCSSFIHFKHCSIEEIFDVLLLFSLDHCRWRCNIHEEYDRCYRNCDRLLALRFFFLQLFIYRPICNFIWRNPYIYILHRAMHSVEGRRSISPLFCVVTIFVSTIQTFSYENYSNSEV